MRTVSRFLFLILAGSLILSLNIGVVRAQPILGPAWTPTPPSIDGVLSLNEWSLADSESFTFGPESNDPATIYVMNDANNLYVAVTINDNEPENDRLSILFDNDNGGGAVAQGDDALVWWRDSYSSSSFHDSYQAPNPLAKDTDDGGTEDGNSARTQDSSNVWYYEFSHPLDSSDNGHDFSLAYGSVVGFALHWDDANPSVPDLQNTWPSQNPDNYGDMIVASPPPRPVIESQWTNNPPSIDGIVQAGEWSNLVISFTSPQYPDSYVLPTYVYFMNDATYLYVLVDAVGDTTDGTSDECLLTFNYEDSLPYFQHYARISGNTAAQSTSGNIEFEGRLGFNGHKVYEFAIPLSNINAQPGQAIDFCSPAYGVKSASIPYDADSNPRRDNVWPQDLVVENSYSWGMLNLRGADHAVGGELFTANKPAMLSPYVALLGLFGILSAVVIKRLRN